MILVDTSAWVEFDRDTDSPVTDRVEALLGSGDAALSEPVAMELLAGARDSGHLADLERLVGALPTLHCLPGVDFANAAELYRLARLSGRAPRSLIDCLVAAVALRNEVDLLARDQDFAALAAVSQLRLDPAST